jgi:outer membrane biosynthesis protein TonB
MMGKPRTIEVRVSIDATGRVTRVEAKPQRGVNSAVRKSIESSARSWTFKPARQGDEPIPSEFVLQFHFANQ